MKKNSKLVVKSGTSKQRDTETIGIDMGDDTSQYCVLNGNGEVVEKGSLPNTEKGVMKVFGRRKRCRVALEAGGQSWAMGRWLRGLGYEVIVANPRQLKLITQSSRKSDDVDAEMLARLARVDPKLLRPIRHRSEKAQMALMRIRVRARLVEARTALVNGMRGLAKITGERVPACDPDVLRQERLEGLSVELQTVLKPLMEQIKSLTAQIQECDRNLEQIAREEYPETELLTQVYGVGTLIALTFCLTVDDKERFSKSRDVGAYVGLRPKQSQSGESDPQLGITKEGDVYLRKLLVQGAHRILARRSPDTDLKRWGWKLAERGGKNAKKRAIVAVARKLGILLHRLWVTAEVYEPLRNAEARSAGKAAA